MKFERCLVTETQLVTIAKKHRFILGYWKGIPRFMMLVKPLSTIDGDFLGMDKRLHAGIIANRVNAKMYIRDRKVRKVDRTTDVSRMKEKR